MTRSLPQFDAAVLEEVSARLDLRDPNRDAIQTVAMCLERHDDPHVPFEAVLDSATGVGKTYVIAGAIEYFTELGLRNFAIIAPGQTILAKTSAQFTPGTERSLRGLMQTAPVVITSENFRSPAMRAAMDDPERVKLFIFTVQSLMKPSTKTGRRTHEFQEGLGSAFYEHLDELTDLMVFADEHHCYYGEKFSQAIRDLTPLALIGLTGTPHKKTPAEQIIFRYPLTAAIADQLVKTPVIVGRRDDLVDEHTQLLDGARLLEAKQTTLDLYCAQEGVPRQNATMLVNCKDIAHAQEVEALLTSPQFCDGRYERAVLRVDSSQTEDALTKLETVEHPASPVRIIVQVGMLKEGWDVRTVYVIASLRASVSEILTEQTMGRGLRLPFGKYTGWDMLDTLDILAHEQYEKVLVRTKALHEQFIDYRTVIRTGIDMTGAPVTTIDEVPERFEFVSAEDAEKTEKGAGPIWPAGGIRIVDQGSREAEAEAPPMIHPRRDTPGIPVPVVTDVPQPAKFSLADITDTGPYSALGRRLAKTPDDTLRRTRIGAKIVETSGGRSTETVSGGTIDVISSPALAIPRDEARRRIVTGVRSHSSVPGRAGEGAQIERLLEYVVEGIGDTADSILGAYPDLVAREMLTLIINDQKRYTQPAGNEPHIEVATLRLGPRVSRHRRSESHLDTFSRQVAYGAWARSLYPDVIFDSSTERALAVVVDSAPEVQWWLRLERNNLPIEWRAGQRYNPDFLINDASGMSLVEVKADRDLETDLVQAKRQAALRWVNVVKGSTLMDHEWRYLLVSESDLKACKGSWKRLVGLVERS